MESKLPGAIAYCLRVLLAATIFSIISYFSVLQFIVEPTIFENTEDAKEIFPTMHEIINGVSDKTMVIVKNNLFSAVYYFDKNGEYKVWSSNEIQKGYWRLFWRIQPFFRAGYYRLTIVWRFCQKLYDEADEAQQENCISVHDNGDILNSYGYDRETINGDAFGVNQLSSAPFELPVNIVELHMALNEIRASRSGSKN